MTDGGHVPSEGLPEHQLAGPDPAGRPEGVAVPVAPAQGVAVQGGAVHGIPAQGYPQTAPVAAVPAPGVPAHGMLPLGTEAGLQRPGFTFLDQPDQQDQLDDEDDLLLMPGPQGSWSEPVVLGAPDLVPGAEGLPAVDTVALRSLGEQPAGVPVEPSWPPLAPPVVTVEPAAAVPAPVTAPATDVAAPAVPGAESVAQAAEPSAPAAVPAPAPVVATPVAPVQAAQAAEQLTSAQQPRRPLHAGPPIPDPSLMTGHVPVRSLADRGPSQGATPPHGVPVPAMVRPEQPQPAASAVVVETAAPVQVAVPVAETPAVEAPAAEPVVVEAPAEPQPQAFEVAPTAAVHTASVHTTAAHAAPVESAVAEPAPVEPVVAEAVAAIAPVAPVDAAPEQPQPVAPVAPVAPAAQSRRISAFLAAPTPHGLPTVEAVAPPAQAPVEAPEQLTPVQPVPEPTAEPVAEPVAEAVLVAEAEPKPEAEVEPALAEAVAPVEPVAEPAAAATETAAGTGDMAAAQTVDAPEAPDAPAAEPQPSEPQALQLETAQPQPVQPQPVQPQAPETAAPEEPVVVLAEAPAAEEAPAGPESASDSEEGPAITETADTTDVENADVETVTEPRPPAAPGYDEAGRDAVHQVIRERRDVRNGFRPDPIPHEVLIRVLEAAHTAPSVGYSQPWDFVVIRSAKTRRRMHELAERQREAYADSLPKGRAKQFKEIKIEAILDTPVNIVVTADRTRGGRHTLGRHTQPQMAPYSAALAVENLWLAARAEGLGVGWVSFFDEDEMVRELGLPEHLEVVAYLCVGYVDSFPEEPELQQQGWAKKRPLSWVVHEEQYGNRALPGEEPHSLLADTLRGIRPLDAKALGEAWDRQKRMTKPAGSLGMLEIISAQLCGLSRKCPPPIPEPGCVAIFAGDHGVHAQGVSPWPQEVTAQMVANFLAGGAVINSFAKQIGTEVVVVDVGVKTELPDAIQSGRTTGLLPRKVKPGTDDMTQGPAMSREEALKAIEVGIETARDLVAAGNKILITGDMGIGNTTASAALISVFAGLDPAEVTGRGTGIDDAMHAHKIEVIRAALALHQPDPSDPIGVLAAVGGLEHAAIAGFVLGAASLRTPVILDGVIAGSAALAAKAIAPEVLAACIAGHRSAEPGHQAALAKLGLRPLIDLDLRLGEGTGALLALPLVQSAARSMHDVATFDSAGVTEKG